MITHLIFKHLILECTRMRSAYIPVPIIKETVTIRKCISKSTIKIQTQIQAVFRHNHISNYRNNLNYTGCLQYIELAFLSKIASLWKESGGGRSVMSFMRNMIVCMIFFISAKFHRHGNELEKPLPIRPRFRSSIAVSI